MMQFDAVKVKESKKPNQTRQEKKITKQINKINKVYPVCGVTEEEFIKSKIGATVVYFEILDVRKYDLFLMDEQEFQFVTENNWKFQKQYPFPIKEVYMNFPEDNQQQQDYFKHKIERTANPAQLEALHTELEKLKHIEKTYEMRDTYLFVFGKSVEELQKRLEQVRRFNNFLGVNTVPMRKKEKILFRLNNHNTRR